MQFKIKFLICFVLLSSFLKAQETNPLMATDAKAQQKWVDSIYKKLSLNDKIGQLFMMEVYSNKDVAHSLSVKKLIKKHHIGSLIFMQGSPLAQAKLTNEYQALSKVPLLIGIDAEWGLNMRLDSTYRFPWNMTLGAIKNDSLLMALGKRIGEQCKRLGIHVNFAPVVDVNTNPLNPIIGNRSFGQDPKNVSAKALAFMKGIQSQNVLTTAKHFPGHGDTSTDSHQQLPIVLHTKAYMDSVDLAPYKTLIKNGLTGVMVAHLNVPSLDAEPKLPTSLSAKVIDKLLKKEMGFKGLVFTDALNMKGVANFGKSTTVDLKAFMAGNDVLMFSKDIPKAINKIKEAINAGTISPAHLENAVKKILMAKYWVGLNHYKPILEANLTADLATINDQLLERKLMGKAITLVKNQLKIFPIADVTQKIAYVKLGDATNNYFLESLKKYTRIDVISGVNDAQLNAKLQAYDLVIVGFHKSSDTPWKSYKFSEAELTTLLSIARNNKVILDIFASPYALLQIKSFTDIEAVMVSYQNSDVAQELSAQMLFGALKTEGKLPVSIKTDFKLGLGLASEDLKRLSYGLPEEVGMSSLKLKRLDSMALAVLTEKMTPGLQLLVARNGKVVFQKSYGHFTDINSPNVENNSLYDLASLTKIMGVLPLTMKAFEEGQFNLETRLDSLFPILLGTNKDTVTVKEALSHVGRISAWIPFYKKTIDSLTHQPSQTYYRTSKSDDFNILIADNLYLRHDYIDSIYKAIADEPQRLKTGYKYSDLVFYLFRDYFEKSYQKSLQDIDNQYFYQPLGANYLTFLPREKFDVSNIVPTEIDNYFRHQLLQGYVHDMGAAMMGGVNGNAGLFSNANDVAKMMQLYLQKGFYGGKRYFKEQTFDIFNQRYFEKEGVRRGLVLDKPQLNPKELATCGCVSNQSFGHSGFTGNFTWADPESGIVYVFLSNRIYPTAANETLVKKDVRTKAQQIIQEAIMSSDEASTLAKVTN